MLANVVSLLWPVIVIALRSTAIRFERYVSASMQRNSIRLLQMKAVVDELLSVCWKRSYPIKLYLIAAHFNVCSYFGIC